MEKNRDRAVELLEHYLRLASQGIERAFNNLDGQAEIAAIVDHIIAAAIDKIREGDAPPIRPEPEPKAIDYPERPTVIEPTEPWPEPERRRDSEHWSVEDQGHYWTGAGHEIWEFAIITPEGLRVAVVSWEDDREMGRKVARRMAASRGMEEACSSALTYALANDRVKLVQVLTQAIKIALHEY